MSLLRLFPEDRVFPSWNAAINTFLVEIQSRIMASLVRPTRAWANFRASLNLRDLGIFDLEGEDDEEVFRGVERIASTQLPDMSQRFRDLSLPTTSQKATSYSASW